MNGVGYSVEMVHRNIVELNLTRRLSRSRFGRRFGFFILHKLIKTQLSSALNLLVSAMLLPYELLQFVSIQWHTHTHTADRRCVVIMSIGSKLHCWLAAACYEE
jgi:hypothetical protein